MEIPDVKQKFVNPINTVTIGATKEEGGTRSHTITIGGETTLPYLHFEGEIPYPPVIAMEVWDVAPSDWPDALAEHFSDVWSDPGEWAKKCVEEFDADLICLRLQGCDPEGEDKSADEASQAVKKVLEAVKVPLIIWGCGNKEKDNEIFPACSQAASGERCLLGTITEDNYKTLVALCQADKHKVIAESPVDINIAKQVNILATDAGLSEKDIVIYPTTGALGYGIEYVYSIMERGRIAGLGGDKMWAMPILGDIGKEVWKVKEALVSEKDIPEWGDQTQRGPLWEFITAVVYLQAGADILIMRHPKAVKETKRYIESLMKG
ncbi:MAG TPA: acetyl-CoA decarbonylase/synthase complex subunit delta [Candidatus Aerophobetes bacterium]|uniref:Acetyl-CoA decarbonylase/synthase complex subunit delta n=1 Tax=Aerophobetes bacterium TaxID=2030807 RepID=A0A7V5LYI2_UNCAE|nr:acetyl-CoA decarbonylase/synthase complex subunit delta [Candidatus Aerophobetes bacterium]